jgi:CRP/FNR family transcriptional regulator, cyclic AMP receptor protein
MNNDPYKKYEYIMKIGLGGLEAIDNEIIFNYGKTFQKGDFIIKEGDKTKDVYLILKGRVIVAKDVKTVNKVLTILGPGEIIGEMSFFGTSARSASCIADTNVIVMAFTAETFSEIYKVHPRWFEQILKSLSKRIINTMELLKVKVD